jgi:hypothetical protein
LFTCFATQGSCYAATLGYRTQPLCGWDAKLVCNNEGLRPWLLTVAAPRLFSTHNQDAHTHLGRLERIQV